MTHEQKLHELMRKTGKGNLACDICLQMAGGNVDKALERMKLSYPTSMEIKTNDTK